MKPYARARAHTSILAALFSLAAVSTALAVCGNGFPDPGELCDDGNLVNADGCDANCTPTGCGNGIPTAGEACDDGAFGSATCDPDCTPAACGDTTLNPTAGEQCDDGNLVNGDAATPTAP